MEVIDYSIVVIYFILSFGIAAYYYKRAGKSSEEFFLSGRNLPWYLAGLSMVATTFAADTPLAVTELVAKNGVAGNWVWWNFAFGGLLTVFFFARLWRRSGVMTEVEFTELRYSGKQAGFLRGFRSIYLGLFMNVIIIGWVNAAMIAILQGMFGIPESQVMIYVFAAMLFVAIYSAISGLWGVVVTDAVQFMIAMGGTIVLAVVVVSSPEIGGISGLKEKLPPSTFEFFPRIVSVGAGDVAGAMSITLVAFLAFIGIQWWASWYPGQEPGGGGYIAQRMMSAKDEKHSLYATLFFQIAHYGLRPWPWILVGLSTLVLYPDLTDKKLGYIYAMNDFLPAGLKGLLVAAFFAAFMSTIATQLNWGTSYLINDFYKRFVKPLSTEKEMVAASRIVTLLLMVVGAIATMYITRISGAWEFILEAGAGLGLVLILRWYWWRINAWSEISAMVAPFVFLPLVRYFSIEFPFSLYYLVSATTIVWIVVTFATKPESEETLIRFYQKVYPGGRFWKPISDKVGKIDGSSESKFGLMFIGWFAGVVLVYSVLFGIGSLLFDTWQMAALYFVASAASTTVIAVVFNEYGWKNLN